MKREVSLAVEKLALQAESWGVDISAAQEEVLVAYARELACYEQANVIGTREIEEVLLSHVLDSLSCLIFSPLNRAQRTVDVGSGGGLPGLPLKVLRPGLATALLEATGKKAQFLRYVVEKLGIEGVEVVNDRAENVGRSPEYRGEYDVATVRAVATLDVISEYCVPLIKEGGYVISMKGDLEPREIEAGGDAARLLGAEIAQIIEVPFLPELPDKRRTLVILRKLVKTPEQYPRKDGVPRKKPLGTIKRK